MTSYPTRDNADHWWLVTGRWNRLHAVSRDQVDPNDEDACEELRIEGPTLTTRCGHRWPMSWPGLFTRLAQDRCVHCCRALGVPTGRGTLANWESRELREASTEGDRP